MDQVIGAAGKRRDFSCPVNGSFHSAEFLGVKVDAEIASCRTAFEKRSSRVSVTHPNLENRSRLQRAGNGPLGFVIGDPLKKASSQGICRVGGNAKIIVAGQTQLQN